MKLNNTFTYLIFLFFILNLCSSCGCTQTNHLYSGARHLPLKEKNDIQVAVSFRGVQAGYSPIKHLGIQGNFIQKKDKISEIEKGVTTYCDSRYQTTDLAIGGYYIPSFDFLKNAEHETLLFSAYAGYGEGNFYHGFNEELFHSFDFKKFYQQLSVQLFVPKIQLSYFYKREKIDLLKGKLEGRYTPLDVIQFERILDTDDSVYHTSTVKAAAELDVLWFYAAFSWNHRNTPNINNISGTYFDAGITLDISDIYKKLFKKDK